jgi:type III secretion protein Q
VPRVSRRDAAFASAVARWFASRPRGGKLATLLGGPVGARWIGVMARAPDPHAAVAEVRRAGVAITVTASSLPIRALAQRLLGGPAELDAPRPLTVVEHAIWALAVAAGLADLGIAAEVWPLAGGGGASPAATPITVGIGVELPGLAGPLTVTAQVPAELVMRAPPPRPPHGWRLDLPIVVGRCALARASLAGLTAGDVVTIERRLELVVGGGGIGLSALPGAVEARVVTEYVPRDMALPDEAHFELTVQLGTARMSLRELGELAIGQIVALGRPLAGPYEVRAAGRVVGHGELVDIAGELGVRIVSIAEQPDQE